MNEALHFVLSTCVAFSTVFLMEGEVAANSPANRVCFEHIGLQEKPMPEFCVDTVLPALGESDTVVVSAPTLASIHSLCERARGYNPVGDPGTYRWTVDRNSAMGGVIGPPIMLQIVNAIRQDAADQGRLVPDFIVRLARRLST